ncbi:MAG: penicillin-binding protein [bacterium]|nr:penicillin-binding protein [bacterium]
MAKKSSKSRKLNVYSNLTRRLKTKKDSSARKRAEYLASLPKNPVQRFFYRVHPKRFWSYWFSRRGLFMLIKLVGIFILLMVLLAGALFAYYRKDLDAIRPSELAKQVQTTVSKYYDRNDKLLWEDKGEGNYKLTVKADQISEYMKQATVAIEDRNFYKHGGISPIGIARAAITDLRGESIQGGSTLTQQLVKQVYFADEAHDRSLSGIPRKIKEMILAIEVERLYDKDQILTLYLNESPYGGRRNGVQSASQTYFGIPASKINLPQAALLAGVPNQPGLYDPYNEAGNEALINRQHEVLNKMVANNYITQKEADDAKKVPILDKIRPESDQYSNIKAPHFVQMVRSQLEAELGKATVGKGGLTIKTTLDWGVQKELKKAMKKEFKTYDPSYYGFNNGAATVQDNTNGQIIALMGSRDYNYPGYGQNNAATSFIQPGSSIKPEVYAQLLKSDGFGSGTKTLTDSNDFAKEYGAPLQNADKRFEGAITLRKALAESRNIPAVKAMYVAGVESTIDNIRKMGDKYYCTRGVEQQAGLSAAIGGCGTRQIDHVNAFATLANAGTRHEQSSILSVKNSQGQTLIKWKDKSKQILDPEIAYIIGDILSDPYARLGLTKGRYVTGVEIPGIKTAVKTGTSDLNGKPRDLWVMTYSKKISMGVWLGNATTKALKNGNSLIPGKIVDPVMKYTDKHYDEGVKSKYGAWLKEPKGIKHIGGELYPSWYKKSSSGTSMTFDKVSKKLATKCTPSGAEIKLTVTKSTNPITKKDIYMAPDGYDASQKDDKHKCGDDKPTVSAKREGNKIVADYSQGGHGLDTLYFIVDGKTVHKESVSGNGSSSYTYTGDGNKAYVKVEDSYYYTGRSGTFSL